MGPSEPTKVPQSALPIKGVGEAVRGRKDPCRVKNIETAILTKVSLCFLKDKHAKSERQSAEGRFIQTYVARAAYECFGGSSGDGRDPVGLQVKGPSGLFHEGIHIFVLVMYCFCSVG